MSTTLTDTTASTSDSISWEIEKATLCGSYDREFDEEEIDWMRSGWNNPRSIPIPNLKMGNRININTRNNLPRKKYRLL